MSNPLGNINGIKCDGVSYVILKEDLYIHHCKAINKKMEQIQTLFDEVSELIDDIESNYTFNDWEVEDYD